jgi:hypothetical protein
MHDDHLPTTPGAIIGYRKNGAPIRLIAGASETPPEPPAGDPAPPPAPAADPSPPAQDPAPAGGQEPPAPSAEATSVEQLPPWAQKLVRDTRNEAALHRTKAKEREDALTALEAKSQQQLDGIAKALGLKPEEATPEQIMAERDAANAKASANEARAREAAVELAVFRASAAAQVNGNALLDSRSFVATLAGLNPAAADFGQRVNDAITAATEAHPEWKTAAPAAPAPPVTPVPPASPAPARSGGEHTTPGGNRQWTMEDVRAAKDDPGAVTAAVEAGLLTSLGYSPTRKRR